MPTLLEKMQTAPAAPNGKQRRLITKDGIKAAKPRTFEDVPCDEWEPDTSIRVGPMDYATHDLWQQAVLSMKEDANNDALKGFVLKVVGRSMIDEDRNRMFATDEEIAAFLNPRDARPINRAFDVVIRLSKDLDKQVEEVAKNSDSAPSDGRSTS